MAAKSNIQRFSKLVTDPIRSFRFLAEFTVSSTGDAVFNNDLISFSGGFTSISGLAISTQSIGYREGGFNTTLHQVPGMTQFQPITFQRGTLFGKDEAITWMRGLFGAAAGEGVALGGRSFRCNVDIYVLDHPAADVSDTENLISNRSKMRFRVHNAWITNLAYSDLNAGDNQLLYETMTLVHEGLSVRFED